MMRNGYSVSLCLIAFAVCGSVARAEGFRANLEISTEYAFRGLQMSRDDPVPSAMLEYEHSTGIYGGLWVTDLGSSSRFRGHSEIDYFIGIARNINDDFAINSTLIRYTNPNAIPTIDYDWNELLVSLQWQENFTLALAVNDNWFAQQKRARLAELTYRNVLPFDVVWDLTVGFAKTQPLFGADYGYFEAGFNKTFSILHLRAAYTGTNRHGRQIFGDDYAAGRWIFSAAVGF